MTVDLNHLARLAHLPLRARRSALRVIWHTMRLTGQLPSLGIDKMLTYAIRTSRAEAIRLESEILFQDMLTTLEWAALLARSRSGAMRDTRAVTFETPDLLTQVARSGKPVIFAPLHMGCFALSLPKLMSEYFPDRPMLILRAREDRPHETKAMERISEIGVNMRFLNVTKKNTYLDAIRFARNGAVILIFIDLPANYGSPSPVTLFGRKASLAMGLNSLARVTGARVIPMSVTSSSVGDTVRFGTPFESYRPGADEKARVAELIRRFIEQSVLAAPEQWHMWPRFNEFLEHDLESEAA